MLPLSDRVLLRLARGPASARDLARELCTDGAALHRVLCGLEEDGVVERVAVPREASAWRLAPGVRVEHRPARVVVTGGRPPGPRPPPSATCRAVGSRGRGCRLAAAREGLCFLHAPAAAGPDEGSSLRT